MAKSIEEQLKEIKRAKDLADLPPETDVTIVDNPPVEEGTRVEIEETLDIPEANVDSARPKTVPKGNRRGSKALILELEKTKTLAVNNEEKYKRLLAEFENVRQRHDKESKKLYDIGAKEVLEELLTVVDNFDRAIANISEEDSTKAFEQGMIMIYKQLLSTLESIGVVPIEAVGNKFNPDLHNAVIHIEDKEYGDNVVVEEMQKGYMYKDQVLRYSMVKVAN